MNSNCDKETFSRPPRVWLWVAGSGEGEIPHHGPAVAWRVWTGDGATIDHSRRFDRTQGDTLHSAILLVSTEVARGLPLGAQLHFFCSVAFIVDALGGGGLSRWASAGFVRKPEHHKDEWRALWEVITSRNLTVSAVRPAKGAMDRKTLDDLYGVAVRLRTGWAPIVNNGQRAKGKSILELMNEPSSHEGHQGE